MSRILAAWDIDPVSQVVEIHPGRVFRVNCARGGPWILKDIGEANRQTTQRLAFEYDVLCHLDRAGLSVAVPLRGRHGDPCVGQDGRLYTLSPYLVTDTRWEDLDREGLKRLNHNCGAAIARLHIALAAFPTQGLENRTWKTVLPDAFLECVPVVQRNLSGEARARFDALADEVAASMRATLHGLPMQLIHRDCHHGNVIVDGERVSGFVDCDHLSIGPRIFDIADFIVHMIKQFVADEQRTAEWFLLFPAVLSGYDQENELLPQEKRALCDAMLGILLMFVAWFFRAGDRACAQADLEALVWMVHNRQKIGAQIVL